MSNNQLNLSDLTAKPMQEKLFNFYAKLPIIFACCIVILCVPTGLFLSIELEEAGIFFTMCFSGAVVAVITYFLTAIPLSCIVLHIYYQREISEKLTKVIENTAEKQPAQKEEVSN